LLFGLALSNPQSLAFHIPLMVVPAAEFCLADHPLAPRRRMGQARLAIAPRSAREVILAGSGSVLEIVKRRDCVFFNLNHFSQC